MKVGDIYVVSDSKHNTGTSEYANGKIKDLKCVLKKEKKSEFKYVNRIEILLTNFKYKKTNSTSMNIVYCVDNNITFSAESFWIENFFILKPKNYNKYWAELNK